MVKRVKNKERNIDNTIKKIIKKIGIEK